MSGSQVYFPWSPYCLLFNFLITEKLLNLPKRKDKNNNEPPHSPNPGLLIVNILSILFSPSTILRGEGGREHAGGFKINVELHHFIP